MLLIILLVTTAILVYFWTVKPMKFWEEKGVPYVKPIYIFGNTAQNIFRRKTFSEMLEGFYKEFPTKRYFGIYQFLQPTLVIKDPDLIKQITVKDFDYFPEHRSFVSEDADPLWGRNLFATREKKWREMRPTLSPSFTSSKMKFMFTLMSETSEQFVEYFTGKTKVGEVEDVEMKDIFTRYTNDVIASTAFGLRCDSLKEKNNEFYLMGKDATDFSGFKGLKFFLYSLSPFLMKTLGIKIFSTKVATFFRSIIKENIRNREEHGIVRPDMIHLLLEARKGKLRQEEANGVPDTGFATVEESNLGKVTAEKQKSLITDDDITAQALIFFLAGFDTAATLMCYIAYELAVNPEVQDRLREEIDAVCDECNEKVTYEALMKMKYMDMVVSETLRKWPPSILTDRLAVRPYTIEPKNSDEKPLHLEKGSVLWVPIFSIHRDEKFYPNPDKFDPDRFSDENKGKINPYTYIPFGSGPRNCIGSRFAILENKTIFFYLLRNFEIVPNAKTPIPIVFSKKHFNLMPIGGFQMGLKRRT